MGVGLGHGDGPIDPGRLLRGGGTGAEFCSPFGGKGGRIGCR